MYYALSLSSFLSLSVAYKSIILIKFNFHFFVYSVAYVGSRKGTSSKVSTDYSWKTGAAHHPCTSVEYSRICFRYRWQTGIFVRVCPAVMMNQYLPCTFTHSGCCLSAAFVTYKEITEKQSPLIYICRKYNYFPPALLKYPWVSVSVRSNNRPYYKMVDNNSILLYLC